MLPRSWFSCIQKINRCTHGVIDDCEIQISDSGIFKIIQRVLQVLGQNLETAQVYTGGDAVDLSVNITHVLERMGKGVIINTHP